MTIPRSESELLARAQGLAGLSLRELTAQHHSVVPNTLRHAKGWLGQFLEALLGASAGSESKPDFPHLGIELKTLPINKLGKPQESTYVCVVPMMHIAGLTWYQSAVYQKLSHVLWIPYEADADIPIPDRRIGYPILWRPDQAQEQVLKQDFEELMEMVCLGELARLHARLGTYLQIRPKAANSKVVRTAIGSEGNKIQTLPLGFYLRARFTEQVIKS